MVMIRVFVPPHMSIYCIAESSKVSAEAVGTSRVIQCSSGIVKQMCRTFHFPYALNFPRPCSVQRSPDENCKGGTRATCRRMHPVTPSSSRTTQRHPRHRNLGLHWRRESMKTSSMLSAKSSSLPSMAIHRHVPLYTNIACGQR